MSGELEGLKVAVREELSDLWGDLHRAQTYAINGTWSIACGNLEERIKLLTPLVGATPWDEIQIPLLENGVYQRIHGDLGIVVEPDMGRVALVRARINAETP
ncbi:hypothetical protein ACIRU8_39490 [Streptomyces sp. NPDC101175]|uniref:hypothetical protein n=1 Tax=Streptomyces sp. NPDC101175 TaxID=3366123 RepID=UPI00383410AA